MYCTCMCSFISLAFRLINYSVHEVSCWWLFEIWVSSLNAICGYSSRTSFLLYWTSQYAYLVYLGRCLQPHTKTKCNKNDLISIVTWPNNCHLFYPTFIPSHFVVCLPHQGILPKWDVDLSLALEYRLHDSKRICN